MSTTRLGRALPASTPPLPNRMSFRWSVVETMVKRVAGGGMGALSVTTSAPMCASGWALDAVRFHTDRPCPALTRRAAMASPMRPRPIQPMSCDALLSMRGEPCRCSCVVGCAAVWEPTTSLSMSLARTLCLLLIAVLGSCSGLLPNSAVSRHMANRFEGAVNSATPVAKVIHDRGIRVPDQQSDVPLLEQLHAELAKSDIDGAFAGITYDLTRGNTLPQDWIVSTPTNWGRKASDLRFYPMECKGCDPDLRLPSCESDADCNGGTCAPIRPSPGRPRDTKRKVCLGHSDALVLQIHDLVASAQRRVDIALLSPGPDTRFLGGLREALVTLAGRGRPITVRVVVGHQPAAEG